MFGGRLLAICVLVKTVNAKEKVGFFDLLGSDLCHGLNWIQTAVLSQRHWDHLQSISKGPHGILFQCWTLKTKQKNHKKPPTNKYQITKKNNMLTANCMMDLDSNLICSLVDSESTGNLWSSSTIHNTVVFDQITNHTKSIVEGSLRLFNNLKKQCVLWTSSYGLA